MEEVYPGVGYTYLRGHTVASEVFYASVISEQLTGTSVTLSGAATILEALTTEGDSKTITLSATGTSATSKVIQCSSFKRLSDNAALSTAIGANDTLNTFVPSLVARAILGDPESDLGYILSQYLRLYDTATQTWSTAGTARNTDQLTFPEDDYAAVSVNKWSTAQPTLALIRSATFALGFKIIADGSTVSCTSEADRFYVTIDYTPASSVAPRSRSAFRNFRAVR